MRTLTKTDLEDILNGTAILGSGGGGPKSIGAQAIKHFESDPTKQVQIADPSEVPDDAMMAVSAAVGSPDRAEGFPLDVAGLAFADLGEQTNTDMTFVLPGEVGAGNSFIPMVVAFDAGLPMVDASGASRSIPTLTQCTYAAFGVPISPLVLANDQQRVTLDVDDAASAEGPMRAVISTKQFGMDAGVAFWQMDGKTMKSVAIPNTLTRALDLGAALRAAGPGDKVEAVRSFLDGYVLATGTVEDVIETTQGGFDFGRVLVKTADGAMLTIYNQNENLIAWRSDRDRPLAIGPDPICYLTSTGETFSNTAVDTYMGKEIVVIGAPATDQMRNPRIVEQFLITLQGLGYAGPYVKIEDLQ